MTRQRWRRLAVTLLLAPITVLALEHVPLPGVDVTAFRLELAGGWLAPSPNLSVLALGIAPLLSAFLVVELAALLVPRWSRLRHGGFEGRAKLARATLLVALVLACAQAY